MMTLVPELNEDETKAEVRKVLKKCRSLQRITGISVDSIKSPEFSDMPKSSNNRNNTENKMIRMLEDVSSSDIGGTNRYVLEIIDIVKALKSLSDLSKDILYYSYCVPNRHSNVKLTNTIKTFREGELGQWEVVYYSLSSIEKLKAQALLEFAEAYRQGELLVYEPS
ncbi:ArpU family phage packaging/lysis transcriptional regulator [Enterococcus sp. LJL128]